MLGSGDASLASPGGLGPGVAKHDAVRAVYPTTVVDLAPVLLKPNLHPPALLHARLRFK